MECSGYCGFDVNQVGAIEGMKFLVANRGPMRISTSRSLPYTIPPRMVPLRLQHVLGLTGCLLFSGCGTASGVVRERASNDFSCPEENIEVESLGGTSYR